MLHRPGVELDLTVDPVQVLWRETPDVAKAQDQHDQMAGFYRSMGVLVCYLEGAGALFPNLCFVRDLFTLTPTGAILAKPASSVRAGEELVAAAALERLAVPIRCCVDGAGVFEAADLMIVNQDLAFVAIGGRTNRDGAVQAIAVLEEEGIGEIIPVRLPRSSMHLDCSLAIVDRDLAAVCAGRVPSACVRALARHGFRIVELPPCEAGAGRMAINMIAVEPGAVLLPAGCPRSRRALEEAGAKCFEADISELLKGRGGIHCLAAPLWREEI